MSRDLLTMVEVLAHEKNVDQSVVLAALESALASAVKKAEFPGEDADIVVKVDPTTGDQKVWRQWLVVPDEQGLQEPDRQILQWEAKEDYSDQGEMNVGDYVRKPLPDVNVTGRRFATDAKQVIIQRLRERRVLQLPAPRPLLPKRAESLVSETLLRRSGLVVRCAAAEPEARNNF